MPTMTRNVPLPANAPALWLRSPTFDTFFLGLSAWIPVALFMPIYYYFGSKAVYPLFLAYLVIFGIPHVFMTWTSAASPSGRKQFKPGTMLIPLASAAAMALAYPLMVGHSIIVYYLSFTAYFGFYHVMKQHIGFHKIYWARYTQAVGKSEADRIFKSLHHVLVWGSVGLYFSRMNGDTIHITLGEQPFDQWYPHGIQLVGFALLTFAIAHLLLAAWRFYHLPARGLARPWASPMLLINVLASFALSFYILPPGDLLLAIALFTSYHNIQYWGFFLHYYQRRCQYEQAKIELDGFEHDELKRLDGLSQLVASGRWKRYMGVAYGYTIIFAIVETLLPTLASNTLAYFHQLLHYTIDGRLWKRKYNPEMGKALSSQRSASKSIPAAAIAIHQS